MDLAAQLEALGLVALAGLLGACIGLDREIAGKPAGLRTHILVAAATCLFSVIAELSVQGFVQTYGTEYLDVDPIRVLQAVIIGIGFLGAGTIVLHPEEHRVEGLTTAASVLVSAGLGLAVAERLYALAVGVTMLAIAVLVGVGHLEHRLSRRRAPPD